MSSINNEEYLKRVRSIENQLRKVNYQKKCLEFKLKVLKEGLSKISLEEIPVNQLTYKFLKDKGFKSTYEVYCIDNFDDLVKDLQYNDAETIVGTIKHIIDVIDNTMNYEE